ncbi:MAG: LLM class flavin-dependent oxidoreductase [Acidimicrobiia bacterium]|nr:LLM class flavin-dependent oxidoreductase [Acidimicrobiia bacterium]
MSPPALSVLDLALVAAGSTTADALSATTELAIAADRLGYRRFWVAEHHNMPTVASTTPSVLMAHLAAHTQHIRVGSGGVMLPNHSPLAVAEAFALLEALHPGRIDLGIGRAPGSDRSTAAILRRGAIQPIDGFPSDLLEVMALLGDIRITDGLYTQVRATPMATSSPTIALLGSSDYSARLSARLGLPFAFAHHFDTGGTEDALRIYRRDYTPSERHPEPHVIVTVSALAAETSERAEWLSAPTRLRRFALRTGRHITLLSPEDANRHPDLGVALSMPSSHIAGDPQQVASGLAQVTERFGADELMIASSAFDVADRSRIWSSSPWEDGDHGTYLRQRRHSCSDPPGLGPSLGSGDTCRVDGRCRID